MPRALTADQVRRQLVDCAAANGSQRELAKQIGCSPQLVTDVIQGRRKPAGKILRWLRLERQVRYVARGE